MNELWFSAGVVGAIVVCALLTEGFFSGSELALVACDKVRLQQRAARGSTGARAALALLARPADLFSTTLFGTNLSTILASAVTTLFLMDRYGPAAGSLALLLAPVILIFAEILPKSIYQHNADRLVDRIAPILWLCRVAFSPVVWLMNHVTHRLLADVRKLSSEPRITRDELRLLLQGEAALQGDIRPSERTMITRILRFAERRAKHLLIPLVELECLPLNANRDAALAIFDLKGYAHLPVFADRVYNVVGILEAADVLCATPQTSLQELMHRPVYCPENMPLTELFRLLRGRHERAAVVVDEYGGAIGLVTLEDLCEEVVGEIRDEFSLEDQLYQRLGKQHYVLQARMDVDAAQLMTGMEFPRGDFKTIGGMLLARFGMIPEVGAQLRIGRWQFTIREADERAIQAVEVAPAPE